MAQPVYKLFLAKWSEAWYQLSEDEQQQHIAKVNAALDQVGGKRMILCTAEWASEQWPFWGIEEFPSLEALQQHSALLAEINHSRYGESWTILGTEWQTTE